MLQKEGPVRMSIGPLRKGRHLSRRPMWSPSHRTQAAASQASSAFSREPRFTATHCQFQELPEEAALVYTQ